MYTGGTREIRDYYKRNPLNPSNHRNVGLIQGDKGSIQGDGGCIQGDPMWDVYREMSDLYRRNRCAIYTGRSMWDVYRGRCAFTTGGSGKPSIQEERCAMYTEGEVNHLYREKR